MTPEKFGPFLLLKKLSEDPIGEVFRAGQVKDGQIETQVLLRSFNGSAIDGRELASDFQRFQSAETNGCNGRTLMVGSVQGVPYAAWDYIPGKNLASLLEHIEFGSNPLPPEHALLIAERVALSLVAAHEAGQPDETTRHGFLVPSLVMLSNEGETRVLGFEVGASLRSQVRDSAGLKSHFGRYLRPEVLAGSNGASGEDAYSLAVILLELLGGRTLPAAEPEGYQGLVRRIVGRGNDELAQLLHDSLTPSPERLDDINAWQRRLSSLMIEGRHKSTTFNLAFFMHSLFRDEIEQEAEEIQAERSLTMLPESSFATPTDGSGGLSGVQEALTARTPGRGSGQFTIEPEYERPLESLEVLDSGLRPITTVAAPHSATDLEITSRDVVPVTQRKQLPLWAGLAFGVIAAGGIGLVAYRMTATPAPAEAATTTQSSAMTIDPGGASDVPLGPLEAAGAAGAETALGGIAVDSDLEAERVAAERQELLDELDQRMAARADEVEASLRSQYSREIAALRAQLEASQERERELRQATNEQGDRAAATSPIAQAGEGPATANALSRQRTAPAPVPIEAIDVRDTASPAGSRPSTDPASTTQTLAAESDNDSAATERVATEGASVADDVATNQVPTATAEPSSASQTPAVDPNTPARIERVVRGQLVSAGPSVTPPSLVSSIDPSFPEVARRLRREGTVWVDVLVGPDGSVENTRIAQGAGFGFDESALRAVRRARFAPPQKNGVDVRMWTRVKVEFQIE